MNNLGRQISSEEYIKQCSNQLLHEATSVRLLQVKNMRGRSNSIPIKNPFHHARLHQLHLWLDVHLTKNFFHSVDQDQLKTQR